MYLTSDRYFAPLLERYGEYNYGETDVFQQLIHEGDTVVDAGANIGCHSLAMGKIVGPRGMVLAFEPQRPIYYALCGTMALNEMWHVNTYLCALGAKRGTTKIPHIRYTDSASFGGVSVGSKTGHDVPVVPLDEFDLPALRLLKADVEGYETEVLLGSRETIRRHRPFLYVENDRKEHSERLIKTMLEFEYQIFLHTPPLFNERNFRGCQENIFPDVGAVMLLGIPAELPVSDISLKRITCQADMIELGQHVI